MSLSHAASAFSNRLFSISVHVELKLDSISNAGVGRDGEIKASSEGSLTLHPSASHGGAGARARACWFKRRARPSGQRHVSRGHVSGGDDTAHV